MTSERPRCEVCASINLYHYKRGDGYRCRRCGLRAYPADNPLPVWAQSLLAVPLSLPLLAYGMARNIWHGIRNPPPEV